MKTLSRWFSPSKQLSNDTEQHLKIVSRICVLDSWKVCWAWIFYHQQNLCLTLNKCTWNVNIFIFLFLSLSQNLISFVSLRESISYIVIFKENQLPNGSSSALYYLFMNILYFNNYIFSFIVNIIAIVFYSNALTILFIFYELLLIKVSDRLFIPSCHVLLK